MIKKNNIKIYTASNGVELNISTPSTKQVISATNNRAQYFAEQAKKYRDEALQHSDNAKYYAEQNSDVTFEYINNIKASLEEQISGKQNKGEYAFQNDIPQKVSELENDSNYINERMFDMRINEIRLPEQTGNNGKFLMTNGVDEQWAGISTFQLFDSILKDHLLTYEESKGLALQGTNVCKEAIAGSRYGYPDFYNKCLEEYNEATTTETINGVTVKVHSNGHKFYNINDKAYIDEFFNAMGSAWFYGVDTENERIFLPRDKYFAIKGVASSIPVVGNGLSLGFTDGVNFAGTMHNSNALDVRADAYRKNIGESYSGSSTGLSNTTVIGVTTDASKSGLVANSSNVIQTNEDKYLYICVGNTTNYEGMTDVVNQGMEILEQVAQKVNIDGTNLNTEGKTLITSYSFPSNRYIDLTLGASGTTYTAPANGYFNLGGTFSTAGRLHFYNNSNDTQGVSAYYVSSKHIAVMLPVQKGDTIAVYYDGTYNASGGAFKFIYAEGEL